MIDRLIPAFLLFYHPLAPLQLLYCCKLPDYFVRLLAPLQLRYCYRIDMPRHAADSLAMVECLAAAGYRPTVYPQVCACACCGSSFAVVLGCLRSNEQWLQPGSWSWHSLRSVLRSVLQTRCKEAAPCSTPFDAASALAGHRAQRVDRPAGQGGGKLRPNPGQARCLRPPGRQQVRASVKELVVW